MAASRTYLFSSYGVLLEIPKGEGVPKGHNYCTVTAFFKNKSVNQKWVSPKYGGGHEMQIEKHSL